MLAHPIVEALHWETTPNYLMRDQDSIFGALFRTRVKNMGVEKEVGSVSQNPWQNPFAEQVVGPIR
jgi:hypothetical protein